MDLAEFSSTIQKPLRQATLMFLLKDNQILLAMKKRGFGVGRWNGVGGKPDAGETIEQTAIRETREEIGVETSDLKKVALLDFYFHDIPAEKNWNQQVVVYTTRKWVGEPQETEEMKPQWFPIASLPFSAMWPDDPLWLPKVLKGSFVNGAFLFGENDRILETLVTEIKPLHQRIIAFVRRFAKKA
jgi:ADP-ribose pyrophosphatase YjhB (NUDIX family)